MCEPEKPFFHYLSSSSKSKLKKKFKNVKLYIKNHKGTQKDPKSVSSDSSSVENEKSEEKKFDEAFSEMESKKWQCFSNKFHSNFKFFIFFQLKHLPQKNGFSQIFLWKFTNIVFFFHKPFCENSQISLIS